MTLAHCAKGFFLLLLARRELEAGAGAALDAAVASARDRGATDREHLYIDALRALLSGDMFAAVARLDRITDRHPVDALAIKLAHGIRFMAGDNHGMRAALEAVLPAWSDAVPEHGYILGCHAFALEETGAYREAEATGRAAVARAPRDAWGLHAVAHVMEMEDRPREGVAWIEAGVNVWRGSNNFGYHILWHQALFYLELGQWPAALDLYDRRIRADCTDDFRDIANAASLLCRLEREGIDVGARWDELADKAEARVDDTSLAFADAHYLRALTAAGREGAAMALVEAMRARAMSGSDTQSEVMRDIGVPVCEAILAAHHHDYGRAVDLLMPLRSALQRLGGSHAQRDVFRQMLIDLAIAAGRLVEARSALSERLSARPGNRWGWRRMERTLDLLHDVSGVAQARQRLLALGTA